MSTLPAHKQAASEAFETEDGPDDMAGSHSIVDPQSVLALVEIAETHITDEEVKALHQVIADLSDYIRRESPRPEAMRLLLRARMAVAITSR